MHKYYKSLQTYFRHICDGIWNCPNGDDEIKCERYKCKGLLKCSSHVSVSVAEICNGFKDCSAGEDEYLCDLPGQCPKTCQCLMYAIMCSKTSLLEMLNILKHNYITIKVTNTMFFVDEHANLAVKNTSISFAWTHSDLTSICFLLKGSLPLLFITDFSRNEIKELRNYCFSSCLKLQIIILQMNLISNIKSRAFENLTKLLTLNLASNKLTKLAANPFKRLQVGILNLSFNDIIYTGGDISSFHLRMLVTTNPGICCVLKHHQTICGLSIYSTIRCERIFASKMQTVVAGFVTLLIVSLNGVSLFIQCRKSFKRSSFTLSIVCLNLNNMLYGIFLTTLLQKHLYSGSFFENVKDQWVNSHLCKILAVTSIFFIFFSIFILNLVNICRFISVKYPLNMSVKSVSVILRYICLGICIIMCITAVTIHPSIFDHRGYELSPWCMIFGSPTHKPITSFLVVSQISTFILTVVLYTFITNKILKRNQNKSKHKQNNSFIVHTILLVAQATLSLLLSSGIFILYLMRSDFSSHFLIWNVVFVLPFSCVISPVIYSLAPILRADRKVIQRTKFKIMK